MLPSLEWSRDIEKTVETEHLNLDMMTTSAAKIEFIKLFGEFPTYGMDIFHVNSINEQLQHLILGVRHDGLRIYKNKGSPKNETLVQ